MSAEDAAEIDEALLERVVIAMLLSRPTLAGIPPRRALADDYEEALPLSLTVQAELVGREIEIVGDYEVTVTLERTFRQPEADQARFQSLWREIIAVLKAPPAGLPVYGELTTLIFDTIDTKSSSAVDEDLISRSVTFTAHMAAS